MRMKNSIKNSIFSMMCVAVTIVVGLFAQSIFLRVLGTEYNGIKSLCSNILSVLGVAELGFGSAIVFGLYRPIAENNKKEIKAYLRFYKNVYTAIAFVILAMGLIILPFVPVLVGEVSVDVNVYIVFFLFLLDTFFSYLLTYKRSMLYADQRNYVLNVINIIFVVVLNVAEMMILLFTGSFYLYLCCKFAFTVLENLAIHQIVNNNYSYLKNLGDSERLSDEKRNEIISKVKGLFFHKIGIFVINGTDNIVISLTDGLGITYVGLYSNYNLILTYVNRLFGNMYSAMTASVGNLLVDGDRDKARGIYKSMLLMNSWIYGFCTISIYLLMGDFIQIWIGREYLLSDFVLLVLAINFYIQGMRKTSITFKEAAGIYYEDRFVPILESILNLVTSIILANVVGLAGVFIGTIISASLLYFYSYPKFVYKKVLGGDYGEFAWTHLKHLFFFICIFLVLKYILIWIEAGNLWTNFILKGIFVFLMTNILYLSIYWKDKDFQYFKEYFRKVLMN